jgi:hypothetical protein
MDVGPLTGQRVIPVFPILRAGEHKRMFAILVEDAGSSSRSNGAVRIGFHMGRTFIGKGRSCLDLIL